MLLVRLKQNPLRPLVQGVVTLLLLISLGCSGGSTVETGRVAGRITLEGQPVTEGMVYLTAPERGIGASAPLGEDGRYAIPDPVEVGDYVVSIGIAPGPDPRPEDGPPQASAPPIDIPQKYRSERTTDLTVTVQKGSNTADFDLQP